MSTSNAVTQFAKRAQHRLNYAQMLRSACYALLVTGVGLLIVSASFVLSGVKVQRLVLVWPAIGGGAFLILHSALLRLRARQAISYADGFFDLEDGLVSATTFIRENQTRGIHGLQLKQTLEECRSRDLRTLPLRIPRTVLALGAVACALTLWLCTFEDSPAVVQARKQAEENEEKSREIKEALKETVEEIEKELDDEEKELFRKSQLAKLVDELEVTKDRKDALRQLASVEKKLRQMSAAMSTKEDEKFLSSLSDKLNAAQETKALGRQLKQKQYLKASQELKKLKPGADQLLARKEPKEKRKLSSLSRQMKKVTSKSNSKSPLRDQTAALSESIDELDEQLEAAFAELEKCELGEECKACLGKKCDAVDGKLAKLCRGLGKLDAKKKFLARLSRLKGCLGNCQGYMLGENQCAAPGGKRAGVGVDRTKREGAQEYGQGETTRLTGLKGKGPSEYAVEDAASGSGVSRLSGKARQTQFQFQVEAFVNREDVPENMKDGVKTYFERIHDANGEARGESNE